ncbi:MAG: Dabb family protein [Opitutales bacterium]|nr:Dabb family protein [Opitutales bacterium]
MIKHIVFWKVKEEVKGKKQADLADEIRRKLEALPSQISEIIDFEVGFNFNPAGVAFEIALYSTFSSKDALQAYQVHPAHVEVKDFIVSVVKETAVVDYEV